MESGLRFTYGPPSNVSVAAMLGIDSRSGPAYLWAAMSRTNWVRAPLLAVLLCGSAQVASAQQAAPPANDAGQRAEQPKIEPEKLSEQQKRENTERFLTAQRRTLARLTTMVKEARNARDMLQLNCLNDKLEQVKGLLRISEAASVSMYDGMGTGDEDQVNSQYTRLALANLKTQGLQAEANQCIGAKAVFTGNTEIQLTIDGDIPGQDPTQPLPPPVGPPLPPVASGS